MFTPDSRLRPSFLFSSGDKLLYEQAIQSIQKSWSVKPNGVCFRNVGSRIRDCKQDCCCREGETFAVDERSSWRHLYHRIKWYTNIPQEEGANVVCETYKKFHNHNVPITTYYLREILGLILKENSFYFKEENFLQTHGTAMGTKMAASFADIFMAEI